MCSCYYFQWEIITCSLEFCLEDLIYKTLVELVSVRVSFALNGVICVAACPGISKEIPHSPLAPDIH